MNKKILLLTLSGILFFSACKKDKEEDVTAPSVHEGKYIRLFLSDQDLTDYYLVSPQSGTVQTFSGHYANGSVYSSPSGRFVSVVNTNDNLVTFFDSGIEEHDTHIHIKGTPKWALTRATGTKPIHYYGRGDDMIIFNDGDGSISHAKESTLHTQATARNFSVGVAHHGAPALFNNNTFAVTEKDGSVAGALPERVKIVDMEGNTLHSSTIQTGGIHGEACDGNIALFGSTNGILKVEKEGDQQLIEYPTTFGTNWLGTIYYGKSAQQFIGFKSKYGVYQIDLDDDTLYAIEESSSLFSVTFDKEGKDLILLYTDGSVKVIDGATFNVISNRSLGIPFPASGSKGNPVVSSSQEYIYITDGIGGAVRMYKKANLDLVRTIALPGKPARMALFGSELVEDDAH
jgi:hypothetical protein